MRFILRSKSNMRMRALGYRCDRKMDVKPFPEQRSKSTTPSPSPSGSSAQVPSAAAAGKPRALATARGIRDAAADASAISFLSTRPLMFVQLLKLSSAIMTSGSPDAANARRYGLDLTLSPRRRKSIEVIDLDPRSPLGGCLSEVDGTSPPNPPVSAGAGRLPTDAPSAPPI